MPAGGILAEVSGYQLGIIEAIGSYSAEGRIVVQHRDRFYCEMVQPIFGTSIEVCSHRNHSGDGVYYRIKTHRIPRLPRLSELNQSEALAFCRAYCEIHGGVKPVTNRRKNGTVIHRPGFRIFGPSALLEAIMPILPFGPKTIQHITNSIPGGYTGSTSYISLQSRDTFALLSSIDGFPRNDRVWDAWDAKIKSIQ